MLSLKCLIDIKGVQPSWQLDKDELSGESGSRDSNVEVADTQMVFKVVGLIEGEEPAKTLRNSP